jgi:hypothetical protein
MVTFRWSGENREFSARYGRQLTAAILLCAAALVFSPRPLPAQSSDGIDDNSVATPAASMGEVSTPSASGWDRIEGPDTDEADGQVMEIPQVIGPGSQAADAGSASDDSAASADNSGDVDNATADRLGNLDDYQNQEADTAAIGFPLVTVPTVVSAPTFGTGTNWLPPGAGSGGMLPVVPVFVRPSGISPIPSTSPMLMPPRGSFVRPGMPLGWWTRAGRR